MNKETTHFNKNLFFRPGSWRTTWPRVGADGSWTGGCGWWPRGRNGYEEAEEEEVAIALDPVHFWHVVVLTYLTIIRRSFSSKDSAVCDINVYKRSYLLSHFLKCRNCICIMMHYGANYGKDVHAKYLFSFVGEGSISLFGDDDYMSYVNATARHRRTLNC